MLLLEPVDADPPELSEAGQLPHGQLGGAASFRSVGARQQQGRVPDDERMRLGQNAAADSMSFLASADELATDRSTPEGRPASSSGGFGLLSSGGAGAGGGGGGAAGAGGGGRRVRGSGGGNVSSQQSAAGGRRRNSGSNAASSYKETSSSEDRQVRPPAFAQHVLKSAWHTSVMHGCRICIRTICTICRASGPTRLPPLLFSTLERFLLSALLPADAWNPGRRALPSSPPLLPPGVPPPRR